MLGFGKSQTKQIIYRTQGKSVLRTVKICITFVNFWNQAIKKCSV